MQTDMRLVENYFNGITDSILKYKEDMSKKFTEIKMSLNKTRIPMIGVSNALVHPYSFDTWGNYHQPYPN